MSLKMAAVRRLHRFTQIKQHCNYIASATQLVNKILLYLLVNLFNLRNLRIKQFF
ncbi:MAG: hypothetical protein AWT59_0478 [Candidatus Gallionella acididurans]|uniref:Uncharacterized protein n=1 Tax=Candidatus Gallionella acididurans TaxID=1796491 RepID=A0A139BWZ0_9PROT|nr:MAG: hypothetical protein AWT59_0478 [Candidatus Gallionella acididurans]